MSNQAQRIQQVLGWGGIFFSTAIACFWAYWGSNENFHEGWFAQNIWQNLGLMLVQYLSPMLVTMALSVLVLCWQRVALPLLLAGAIAVAWFLRSHIGVASLIAIPLVAVGALYQFGTPEPRRWAWRCLLVLPLATVVACSIVPGWKAVHRLDDGNHGMRLVEGNGVTLMWAPEGPGWPDSGTTWNEATRSCAYLNVDGRSLANAPKYLWRLPTVDEAVRSLVFRGSNVGGVWNPQRHEAHYRTTPDKDSPLWKVHSQVIYWWTSTEVDGSRADYISNNGYVIQVSKEIAAGYLAFRCVCEPGKLSVASAH
jgi:hypothetical protein